MRGKPTLAKINKPIITGADLLLRIALPSALEGLTAVFGMGTGVTLLEMAPDIIGLLAFRSNNHITCIFNK